MKVKVTYDLSSILTFLVNNMQFPVNI